MPPETPNKSDDHDPEPAAATTTATDDVVWLYMKKQLLVQQPRESLDFVDDSIDYQSVVQNHPRYVRNGGTPTTNGRSHYGRMNLLRSKGIILFVYVSFV